MIVMEAAQSDLPAARRLAHDLPALAARYAKIPAVWNPGNKCLVRMRLTEPLHDNEKNARALRGFLRRSNFLIAGGLGPTVRLFRTDISHLICVADLLDENPSHPIGAAFLAYYDSLIPVGEIHARVRSSELQNELLQICYHDGQSSPVWYGIEQMLTDLGGTNIRRWHGIANLGYGSVEINHARAEKIAEHPLVREIDLVPRLRRS
jgi:hypothetical protein